MAKFSGYPLTRWKGNRLMILQEEFSYVDKKGKTWLVPTTGELNGATIPRPLWSFLGSPFVGAYRRASVVHDYFVGEGNNPNVTYRERRSADKMFFRACRTDGCSWRFSAMLYIGVSLGSWSSRIGIKHSLLNDEMESLSINEDLRIEKKYLDIKRKIDNIINSEDFDTLEAFIETEIQD